MKKPAFSGVLSVVIATTFLFFTSDILSIDRQLQEPTYKPGEIIVKFKEGAAETLEKQLSKGVSVRALKVSAPLDELSRRYKVKGIKPLIKGFKADRQRMRELLRKDKTSLTKREQHLLRRMERAPKGAKAPELDRIYKIKLEEGQSAEEAVAEYKRNPDVEYAELNYIVSIDLTPNDSLYPIQWPLNNTGQMYPESGNYNHPPGTADCDIDAPEAWDISTGSVEVIIAVIDTGVDYNHRDLQGNMWTDSNGCHGYDFVNSDNYPMDDHGHGTHCAGTIAAKGNNGLDITGVCWNAKIMAVKFLDNTGSGSDDDAVKALYYAVNKGADVTSNSWGASDFSQTLQDAINYAHSQGVITVAAAGNDNQYYFPHYPASMEHVISVAATNSKDEKSTFSNYGAGIDISAPGVDVLSLRATGTSIGTPYDTYTTIASGTSMSCPHVAGVIALLLSQYPDISSDEIAARLLDCTDDISVVNPYYEGLLGHGRLNAYKALRFNSEGTVTLDEEKYSCSDNIEIQVSDFDIRGSGSQQVTLITDGGDCETVTLAEDTNRPWIFAGAIFTSDAPIVVEDGCLQVVNGQTITAVYNDPNYGDIGPSSVQTTATADCEESSIYGVSIHNITSSGARIRFHTNEATTAVIKCGLNCGAPYSIVSEDLQPRKFHDIYLPNLISEARYFFIIEANDIVCNHSVNDNAGECYSFNTNTIPTGLHVPAGYSTIQSAINAASEGQTIWVTDGVYTGNGNRNITFKGKAITVRSENGPENCIIDCEADSVNNYYGFYFSYGEGLDSVINGFTITGAYNSNMYTNGGAGIVCDRDYDGLGQGYGGCHPSILNCIVTGNTALVGGGIACISSNPTIINCTITDNTARDDAGGGIYCHDRSNPTIADCYIKGNKAKYKGGGIHCNGNPTITNCLIVNNSGGFYWGGGISCLNQSSPKITNCTISGNSADAGAGIGCRYLCDPKITNCILWANGTQEIYRYVSAPSITYSDVQGGFSETGNINANPRFVSSVSSGNYYLSQIAAGQITNSPCVDAGSDTAANLGMNVFTTRTDGVCDAGVADMGYHYPPHPFAVKGADIDGDGDIDFADFAILASQWLQEQGEHSADIAPPDGDGFVDYRDLDIFCQHWLKYEEPNVSDPHLKAHWKFDDGNGTAARDSAGDNDGTVYGAIWTTEGKIDGALSFDGSDDYVALSSFTVGTNNGTISLWFKTFTDFSANFSGQGFLISRDTKWYSYLTVAGDGNEPYWIIGETDSQDDYYVAAEGAAPVGLWNHLAVSFYNKTATTYLNGVLIQTKAVTNSSLTLSRIGGRTGVFFNGTIDDVRIYDRALSKEEILQLYQEGLEG
jgi:parallel beta-helix repeat protein